MKLFLISGFCFIFTAIGTQAQIVRIDTLKNTYVYKKPKNNNYTVRSEYLYTLGVKVLGVEQFPKILNQTNVNDYVNTRLNGMTFKFNNNQLSYRISGTVYIKDIAFTNECEDCERLSGKLNDVAVKAGFEKALTSSVIQPYFGSDLGFRRTDFNGESTNINTIIYTPYAAKVERNGAIFGPFIGIKLNVINQFTIEAESGIDLMYSYNRQEKSYHDAGKTKDVKNYTRFEFLSKPLVSLSLQYNFGLNN